MLKAIFSELTIASDLGTNSPNTIWQPVIIENAIINAIECWALGGKWNRLNIGINRRNTAGSPTHPRPKDDKVIPSWQADKYEFKSLTTIKVFLARLLPWSANVSILDFLTFTIANSVATKNPFKNTRKNTAIIFIKIIIYVLFTSQININTNYYIIYY